MVQDRSARPFKPIKLRNGSQHPKVLVMQYRDALHELAAEPQGPKAIVDLWTYCTAPKKEFSGSSENYNLLVSKKLLIALPSFPDAHVQDLIKDVVLSMIKRIERGEDKKIELAGGKPVKQGEIYLLNSPEAPREDKQSKTRPGIKRTKSSGPLI